MCAIPKTICCCTVGWFFKWLFLAGLLTCGLGFFFAFWAFPAAIDWQVRKELNLWKVGSEGYDNFVSKEKRRQGRPCS